MNKKLLETINCMAKAMRCDPVTAINRISLGGVDISRAVWIWLMQIGEPPKEFIEFIEALADNPKRNDLRKFKWFTAYARIMSDWNSRIWGDISNQNEWGIPQTKMILTPRLFGDEGPQPTAQLNDKERIHEWIAKRTQYPAKWLKKTDIQKGLQARYNAHQLEAAIKYLMEKKLIIQKTSEGKGRPAILYAATNKK